MFRAIWVGGTGAIQKRMANPRRTDAVGIDRNPVYESEYGAWWKWGFPRWVALWTIKKHSRRSAGSVADCFLAASLQSLGEALLDLRSLDDLENCLAEQSETEG